MSDQGAKPIIFISYSRKDTDFVRRLAEDLEQAGYDPWWDVADLRGGQVWESEIDKHVRACDAAIVVLSPDSNSSEWVSKETLLAVDLKKPLVPVMFRESPLPLRLINLQFVDFRGSYAEGLRALLQALPALPGSASPAPAARPRPQPRERLYWILVLLAAIILLGGLAWVLRGPLGGLFRATPTPPITNPLMAPALSQATRPSAVTPAESQATRLPTMTPAESQATRPPAVTRPASPSPTGQPTASPAPALDYSPAMGPARDQGTEMSTVGFAVAAALEYQIQKALGKQILISPRYLYYYARLKGGFSTGEDRGAMLEPAVKVLQEEGAVPEEAWPYRAGEFAMEPPAAVETAPHYKIPGNFPVRGVDELKQALRQYGPVVGTLPLFRSVFDVSVTNTGMIWMPDPGDPPIGSIAGCFVGYDDAQKLFKFRGSWGQGWGDGGYGYLSYDYADKYVKDVWAISAVGGGTWTNAKDGATYVLIPPGEFLMGAAAGDPLAVPGEKPQHTVSVPAFWLAQTEATNAQYGRCVDAGACTPPDGDAWRESGNANHPVAGVTWHQAIAYAGWAGGRLPTEAEWEKACRGTDGRTYPWGDDIPPSPALLNCSCAGQNNQTTMPVASFPDGASPYKALDIAGNVWEWTGSLWGKAQGKADFGYPYDPSDGRENLAAPDDVLRVMRGGSFQDRNARSVTCTVRIGGKPADAQPYIGFRVALTP